MSDTWWKLSNTFSYHSLLWLYSLFSDMFDIPRKWLSWHVFWNTLKQKIFKLGNSITKDLQAYICLCCSTSNSSLWEFILSVQLLDNRCCCWGSRLMHTSHLQVEVRDLQISATHFFWNIWSFHAFPHISIQTPNLQSRKTVSAPTPATTLTDKWPTSGKSSLSFVTFYFS